MKFSTNRLLRLFFFTALLSLFLHAQGQPPAGYYDNAVGKQGLALQIALHNIIKGHTSVSYSSLHTYFQSTDKKPNGKVWDMYSDVPGGTPPYQFTFISDKCGTYSQEGDCYNREHSFPQSWFGKQSPMKSDLFHVYPTDGYVNGKRSSYPYGEVGNAVWTSQNGSKLGPCTAPGYSGTVFEPIDEYKGDFARTYFYMAVRYYSEDSGWQNNAAVNGSQPKAWFLNMLYQWNLQDTVSQKEIDRNNAVFNIQHNRNPFIDRPDWVDSLWFPTTSNKGTSKTSLSLSVFPNPATDICNILIFNSKADNKFDIKIYDISGRLIKTETSTQERLIKINMSVLEPGIYFITLENREQGIFKKLKIIKQ